MFTTLNRMKICNQNQQLNEPSDIKSQSSIRQKLSSLFVSSRPKSVSPSYVDSSHFYNEIQT